MSNITPQDLEKNADAILEQLGSENMINWDSIQDSQQKLMQGFQAAMEQFMSFRDNMQRNFLFSLKELKQLDAKDLLKQVKDKKAENSCLKSLVDYSVQDGDKIELDLTALKDDTEQKAKKFNELNEKGVEKLGEITKWIENFVKTNVKSEELQKKTEEVIQEEAKNQVAEQPAKPVSYNFKFDDEKLNNIVSNIKIERIPNTPNLISIKTYSEIVEQSVELAEAEFIRLTFENRKQRREQAKDTAKYLKLMMDHLNDIENMLMKSQEDICQKLGVTQEKLEQSEICLMERGLGQQLFLMQASVRQKIKEKLPKKSNIDAKVTKEVINYQIDVLNKKQDNFLPVLKEMPMTYETQQLVPVILNLMISDLVFDEYNFEEEDYMHNLTDKNYFKEQEIMEMLSGIEQGIVNLLQNSGMIPKGMPGMQGGMPPMGGMGGGMPPMGGMGGGMPPMGGMGGMPGMF